MSNVTTILEAINRGKYDVTLARLYGADAVFSQRERYRRAVNSFVEIYGEEHDISLFSAPGRTEIGGNHTDHNHGCVLAAGVNLDIIGVAAKTDEAMIRIQSAGYRPDCIELNDLSVHSKETNRSASLVRGVAARFEQLGYAVGGLCAYTTSDVLKGSGLSSSAAFEVLIGTMLNHLYNNGAVNAVEIAKVSQYAENVYFGKPSGLMDQMASSVGGIITIDFADVENPQIREVEYDFRKSGHKLCIVDTGGNHAALTHEYAAVTNEMKSVSNLLGVNYLRETTYEAFLEKLPQIRESCGDRAALRAMHFFGDNERVAKEVAALENDDFTAFCRLVIDSGHSSFEYLQNIYSNADVRFQGLSLALALAQRVLGGEGACRVHGGGFGGTTQNFVPTHKVPEFVKTMEAVFGEGSCHILSIRPCGGVQITAE
ncbi:MAG: galactokinase [Clostridia bacterium]|nr:galactokinase [Clostridia bacterium]